MSLLPDKLSAMILLALEDLAKAEESDRYEVEMCVWHMPLVRPNGDHVCKVCLAGAVMAGTLGVPPEDDETPSALENHRPDEKGLRNKLMAMESIRHGHVLDSCRLFHPDLEVDGLGLVVTWPEMPSYDFEPAAWKQAMLEIANYLREMEL